MGEQAAPPETLVRGDHGVKHAPVQKGAQGDEE